MGYSVEGKLVVAISSRALFDFEEENRIFERDGEGAYIALQFARLDVPARPGVAFPLMKKLLAFNTAQAQRVEVVVLSKNDPVSGLRVFKSAKSEGLSLERGVFTRGRSPYRYLEIAEVFERTGKSDTALTWAEQGYAKFPPARDGRLVDFLVSAYARRKRYEDYCPGGCFARTQDWFPCVLLANTARVLVDKKRCCSPKGAV